jgi:hypothetical protein
MLKRNYILAHCNPTWPIWLTHEHAYIYKLITDQGVINLIARHPHPRRRPLLFACVCACNRRKKPVPLGSVAIRVRRRALARYVTAVLLSVHVDVRRGAATLRTTSYGMTPSTTSTARNLPSLPLRRASRRYNI